MESTTPTASQVRHGLRALKTVALTKAPFLEKSERTLLDGVQGVFGTSFDLDTLETIGAPELAAAIPEPCLRRQLAYALLVLASIDGEIQLEELTLIEAYCEALEVGVEELRAARLLAQDKKLRLRMDLLRRLWAVDRLRERVVEEGYGAVRRFLSTNQGSPVGADVVRRFRQLESYPEGTLGRAYFDFCRDNGFRLPAAGGTLSESIVSHDLAHILGGYGTDAASEVQAACFSAGYRARAPFSFVMFVLLQLELGVPGAEVDSSFDVDLAIEALQRGAAMNVDLSEGWDYWEAMARPVEELRREYNIAA